VTVFGYCTVMSTADWLIMIGLWVGVLALVIWAVSRLFPSTRRPDPAERPAHRLARGEVDAAGSRHPKDELAAHGGREGQH
jgi:hypothetical protein